jgi:hypothetical protein
MEVFVRNLRLSPFKADGKVSLAPFLDLLQRCSLVEYLAVPIKNRDELAQLSALEFSYLELLVLKLGPKFDKSFDAADSAPEITLRLPNLKKLRLVAKGSSKHVFLALRCKNPTHQIPTEFWASEDGYADAFGEIYPAWISAVVRGEDTTQIKIGRISNFGDKFSDPYQEDCDAAERHFGKKTKGKWDYTETFSDMDDSMDMDSEEAEAWYQAFGGDAVFDGGDEEGDWEDVDD